ncbi:hypothetical protein SteCoe_19639 [Stentor coeruleus]|uniref:Uncharacterized protein n=1 Tax=Stentor coeruleus TaxID=5963 RepID=A0A1R2BTV5_9CILI|nr:hypothetical protein SteCoe_19639 [Stentor coeruleus]
MDTQGLTNKSRKVLQKKYIDIAYMPETTIFTQRDQGLKCKSPGSMIKKMLFSERIEHKKKYEDLNSHKMNLRLPLIQSPKSSFCLVKAKIFDIDDFGDSRSSLEMYRETLKPKDFSEGNICRQDKFRINPESTQRKGFQGYKYSKLNSNRKVIKTRYIKN